MNILVLTPLVPYPPHDGDKLRLFHFLRYLKSRGHKIDLFCLTRVRSDFQYVSELQALCRKVRIEQLNNVDMFFNFIGGLLIGQSLNVSSYFSPELRDALKAYWQTEEGKSIDVVLVHRLRMIQFLQMHFGFTGKEWAHSQPFFEKPTVVDLTDSLTAYAEQLGKQSGARLSRRLAARWDYWFLKREEVEWSERAHQSILISEGDAQVLREQGLPAEKMTVIPNGVESKSGKSPRPTAYPDKTPVVSFVGNMGYAPNEDGAVWFLEKVWPLIKLRVPGAVFAAVGGQPRERLRKFHNGNDILVTGWVPEIEPYVKHSTLTVAPLRIASGMQNKVALSLSLGVPVVATPSAVSWMPAQGKEFVLQGDGEILFANQVTEVLLNPRRARAMAIRGKRYIFKKYRWAESGRKLEEVLKKAAKSEKFR